MKIEISLSVIGVKFPEEKKKKMQILWGLALYFLITCIGTE